MQGNRIISELKYVLTAESEQNICHLTQNTHTTHTHTHTHTRTQSTRSVFLNILHPQSWAIAANQPNEPKIAEVIRRH